MTEQLSRDSHESEQHRRRTRNPNSGGSLYNQSEKSTGTRSDQQYRSTGETTTDCPDERPACPECNGPLVTEETGTERICDECGLVVGENRIDPGPEWRAFSHEEKQNRARTGAPLTKLRHDDGLSTEIGGLNKDINGNRFSTRKQRQLSRMRKWHKRSQVSSTKERNLRQAIVEIRRMAGAMGLPDSIQETASMIYRRASEAHLIKGRSIESCATAALYIAARLEGKSRTFDEFGRVSRIENGRIKRMFSILSRELELKVGPANPTEYLPRFGSQLDISAETERLTRNIIENFLDEGHHIGKTPTSVVGGALFVASHFTRDQLSQEEIAEVCDTSCVTIRNRSREITDVADLSWITEVEPSESDRSE